MLEGEFIVFLNDVKKLGSGMLMLIMLLWMLMEVLIGDLNVFDGFGVFCSFGGGFD